MQNAHGETSATTIIDPEAEADAKMLNQTTDEATDSTAEAAPAESSADEAPAKKETEAKAEADEAEADEAEEAEAEAPTEDAPAVVTESPEPESDDSEPEATPAETSESTESTEPETSTEEAAAKAAPAETTTDGEAETPAAEGEVAEAAEATTEAESEKPAAEPEVAEATEEDAEQGLRDMSPAQAAEDISPERLEEFNQNRDVLNDEANHHRNQRDDLNANTKKWAQTRDGLNAQVRELVDQANTHRAQRDGYNGEVQKAKEVRDELNKKAAEARTKLNELRSTQVHDEGPSIARLKKKLRALEYEQMTKVLTPTKERALVDEINATMKIIKEKEKVLEADSGSKDAYDAYQKARDEAEGAHKRVTECAELAQREHDAMVKLFESADLLRKEADAAQAEFVKSKVEADRVHREYIEMVNRIRDYEKIIVGLRQKERKAKKEISQAEAKADAEDIYQKFLKGEKLSTDDLMTLQKAGFL